MVELIILTVALSAPCENGVCQIPVAGTIPSTSAGSDRRDHSRRPAAVFPLQVPMAATSQSTAPTAGFANAAEVHPSLRPLRRTTGAVFTFQPARRVAKAQMLRRFLKSRPARRVGRALFRRGD